MGTKMKGLLKGLRYISQIFGEYLYFKPLTNREILPWGSICTIYFPILINAEEEKEAEMQIGNPTDVKHVAHIGWDGPSASIDNSPSWV